MILRMEEEGGGGGGGGGETLLSKLFTVEARLDLNRRGNTAENPRVTEVSICSVVVSSRRRLLHGK